MAFPREFRVGGALHIVAGTDTEQVVADTMAFLDRYFSGGASEITVEERDGLVNRFDRAIAELKKEPRGYLAMGREIVRRIPLA